MTRFRPCIDLHDGAVKQIVGGTLGDDAAALRTNFVSSESPASFAERYRADNLRGGHVIKLGQGNDAAAREALAAWPGGLQVGGGITAETAEDWLEAGASHVIVTSWLFGADGTFSERRLRELERQVGAGRLVLDLSCRRTAHGWSVAMNRWQTLTNLDITYSTLDLLAERCAEFLIHAADVEGLCAGIDTPLVELLGGWRGRPMTYAGGVAAMDDILAVETASGGALDVTVGSALDIFGGTGLEYAGLVEWNRRQPRKQGRS
ncbi:MAG: phosphoribosylformimino-5-aminoimidazole carboxamide ribotide isomerase [Opitutales bacterium]|nr:phosphoribosylformimino-5-aminoimidazole carboxamide ribotide isomerase [Opitutales bacterium]